MSGVFVNVNRGKRSVVLDLRSNAGKDVFIHSMHAKAIARLGFSYDKVDGLTALYATTMELFHRERTGEGQEVEVAMFETMASFMLVEHANGAMFDPRWGPRSRRRRRSRLGLEPILLLRAELPRGSIFRLPPRRVCR